MTEQQKETKGIFTMLMEETERYTELAEIAADQAVQGIEECDRVIKCLAAEFDGATKGAMYLAEWARWHQAKAAYMQVLLKASE